MSCPFNTNLGNQGDLIKDVGGDFIKDVSGDVIKDIQIQVQGDLIYTEDARAHGPGGRLIYCEKKIQLPRFVMLKSKYDGKYLRFAKINDDFLLPQGFLKFEGTELASPQAKFELEMAKCGHGLVHIRCCFNDKYLVRFETSRWIIAAADKPKENTSKTSCTLFQPEPVHNSGGLEFRFRHIQLGMFACLWWGRFSFRFLYFGGLYAGSNVARKDECDVFTVVDWESPGHIFVKN